MVASYQLYRLSDRSDIMSRLSICHLDEAVVIGRSIRILCNLGSFRVIVRCAIGILDDLAL